MVTEINEDNFKEFVSSNKIVLIDFSATWCAPCRIQGKVLEGIEAELGDKVAIAKVDVDQNPNIAREYNIYAVPSLVFFRNGKLVVFNEEGEESIEFLEESEDPSMELAKLVGVQSEEILKKIIELLYSAKD
ncbi:MAG: thioredoxin family protein [Candidatus Jordarchaeum sp.]|uniref:thioredoxin family protein n=1 Tax=Candidatus Jordarchaeum sp. TaxID=2823881 RepID=UPI00404A60E0